MTLRTNPDFQHTKPSSNQPGQANEQVAVAAAVASNENGEEIFQDAVQDTGDDDSKNQSHGCWGYIKKLRDLCGEVVNHEKVQLLIIALIIVNAIMMGIATFDFVAKNKQRRMAFERTDNIFLIIFTIESGMQLIYHGWRLFLDAWLFFDISIIIISWSMSHMQIIRAFRVFRAFRLITRLKSLKNLVMALFSVAPSVGAIMSLLVLIMYIYAVLCTVLFKDFYSRGITEEDYFSRLDTSLFTLFQMITL
jgi:hypothetical protein